MRDTQAKFDANQKGDNEAERTKEINDYEARKDAEKDPEKRGAQPPKYSPGKGFIPAEERNTNFDSDVEKREKAGTALKDNRKVDSPFGVFG